jgi:hypothetical protein
VAEGVGTGRDGDADGRGVPPGVGGDVEDLEVVVVDGVRVALARGVARVDDWPAPVGVPVAPGAVTLAPPPTIAPVLAGVGAPPLPPVPPGVAAEPGLPGVFVEAGVDDGF